MVNQRGDDGGLLDLALFAGAGGGILAGKLLGWRTVCAVEIDAYAASVLLARQNDGTLSPFPIWDDVRTFDGGPWRGRVDVVSGGFPCQDISIAGNGDGLDGERSGLWREFARVVREVVPRFVFVENSATLATRGLDRVLADLAEMGFDARWCVLGVDDVGGYHRRERIFIVGRRQWEPIAMACELPMCECCGEEAYCELHQQHFADCDCIGPDNAEDFGFRLEEIAGRLVAYATSGRLERRHDDGAHANGQAAHGSIATLEQNCAWFDVSNPRTFGSVDDVADRVERTKAIGNGIVPIVAATAWRILTTSATRGVLAITTGCTEIANADIYP